jgi:hypothetical protein
MSYSYVRLFLYGVTTGTGAAQYEKGKAHLTGSAANIHAAQPATTTGTGRKITTMDATATFTNYSYTGATKKITAIPVTK